MLNNTPPATRNLIILNLIIFGIIELAFPYSKVILSAYLPTSPYFQPWQIISHLFIHQSVLALVFNLFAIWNFGNVLERIMGSQRFLILYFLSGLMSYIVFGLWSYYEVHQLTQTLVQKGADMQDIYLSINEINSNDLPEAISLKQYHNLPVYGLSGVIFGLFTAFAIIIPNMELFLFLIPIPIKAKFLLMFSILLSIYLGLDEKGVGMVSYYSFFGGIITAWGLIHNWKRQNQ